MNTLIRPAILSDVPAILALMQEFYEGEHITYDPQHAEAGLEALIRNGEYGLAYTVLAEGEAAGYCIVTFGFSLEFGGRFVLLDELYIREGCRGKGLGRRCLTLAEELCRSEGIGVLRLEVESANERAGEFYAKTGFLEHDRRPMTKWIRVADGGS
jgi:ribosomal protein S18 acetylase RimI-like enzyme